MFYFDELAVGLILGSMLGSGITLLIVTLLKLQAFEVASMCKSTSETKREEVVQKPEGAPPKVVSVEAIPSEAVMDKDKTS